MSAYNSKSATQSFHDPSTYIQRPISAKTPDVAHILTSIFGYNFMQNKHSETTELNANFCFRKFGRTKSSFFSFFVIFI